MPKAVDVLLRTQRQRGLSRRAGVTRYLCARETLNVVAGFMLLAGHDSDDAPTLSGVALEVDEDVDRPFIEGRDASDTVSQVLVLFDGGIYEVSDDTRREYLEHKTQPAHTGRMSYAPLQVRYERERKTTTHVRPKGF